jgi:hypothetical protein
MVNWMFCPECGTENSNNSTFCKKCGEDLSNLQSKRVDTKIKCPYCAEEINSNAIKCKHCGEWINKPEQRYKNEDHSGAIVLGYIFSILGGLLGLIFASYLSIQKSKKANRHGMMMFLIFIYWILWFDWIFSNPYFFPILLMGNILIGLIYGIYISKEGIKISESKKVFILLILTLIIAFLLVNRFFFLTYFEWIYLLDVVLILAIYMVTASKKENR